MSASHAVQTAIRARLVATPALVALVPADNILDRNARPAPDPSIILGEDQEVDEQRIARDTVRVYSTLHVWVREPGLAGAKRIAALIRAAIHTYRLDLAAPWHAADAYVPTMRFLRDPDGETAHGVVTVETLVSEVP